MGLSEAVRYSLELDFERRHAIDSGSWVQAGQVQPASWVSVAQALKETILITILVDFSEFLGKYKLRKFSCIYTRVRTHTHTHTHSNTHIYMYRVSQEKCARLRESVPMLNYTDISQNTYIQS